jgi:hypothetical protein
LGGCESTRVSSLTERQQDDHVTNSPTPEQQKLPPRLQKLTWVDAALAGLAFVLGLALYVRTLAPSLLLGDSAEFQTLSYTLGMTHPTGYPVYLLLGKLFTLLPVGDIAYRVNLMSAVFGALALGLVYLNGRLLGGWRVAAFMGAILLGTGGTFWYQAVIAELYTSAAALLAGVILLVLLSRQTGNAACLLVAGMVGGLSLGVHNTVALAAPGVLVYMVVTFHKRKEWFYAVGGALLGLALAFLAFLILDARAVPSSYYQSVARPSLSVWGLSEEGFDSPFERLAFLYAARQFRPFMFSNPAEVMPELASMYLELLATTYNPIEIGLMVLGLVALTTRRWREGLLFLTGLLVMLVFLFNYTVGDIFVFYIPSYVFLSIAFSMGVAALLDGLGQGLGRSGRISDVWRVRAVRFVGAITFALFAVLTASRVNEPWAASRITFLPDEVDDYPYPVAHPELVHAAAQLVVDNLPDDAIVFTDWDTLYSYYYVAHVEQSRTGIAFHETYPQDGVEEFAQSALAYIDANLGSRPVFFTDPPADLRRCYEFRRVQSGLPLYRIIDTND